MNQPPNISIKGYRVLVQLEDLTRSTIQLPDALKKVKNRGIIVALGDGRFSKDGQIAKFDVQVGDRVLLSEYAVTPYIEDSKEYRICAAEDILGVLA